MNQLMIIGNLGRDPEMSFTPNGTANTKFSVATEDYVGQGQDGQARKETTWHNVIVWSKLAETCNEYLHKGSKVYVSGRLRKNEYEKKDGTKGLWVELVANNVEFLTPKGSSREERPDDIDPEYGKDGNF